MNASTYTLIRDTLINEGHKEDYHYFNAERLCKDANQFFSTYTFVVCNSGMKAQIALQIYKRIIACLSDDGDISTVFGHKLKVKAIKEVFLKRQELFEQFCKTQANGTEAILDFCKRLPHIGGITKYHLAKDLGCDVAKPDRHLVRIASKYGLSAEDLCKKLSKETGDRISAVDFILWRAANLGKL